MLVGHDASVLYREGYLVLVCFPSLESLAVEHTDPALAGGMILGQMFAQQVATEIAVEVPPDRMDVIGVVLRGIVFEEKLRGLNPVVVAFACPLGAHPNEIGLLGIEEGVQVVTCSMTSGRCLAA